MVLARVTTTGELPQISPAQAHQHAVDRLATARARLAGIQADRQLVAHADHALYFYDWRETGGTYRLRFWPVHILKQTPRQYRAQVAPDSDLPLYITKRAFLLPRQALDSEGHARAVRRHTFATADHLLSLLGEEETKAAEGVRWAESRVAQTAAEV